MKILWCVTGAGHFLKEVLEHMSARKSDDITVVYSRAGYEVSRIYGVLGEIGGGFREIIFEEDQGASAPVVGRLAKNEYGCVLVAPCTANTVSKMVYGIADSLVTNIVAQAGKCGVPVYVLPTDLKKDQLTRLPLNIDYDKCAGCVPCPAMDVCPEDAFYISDRVRIDLLRCVCCMKCVDACPHGAVGYGKEVPITCRDLDVGNVARLRQLDGVCVLTDINDLPR